MSHITHILKMAKLLSRFAPLAHLWSLFFESRSSALKISLPLHPHPLPHALVASLSSTGPRKRSNSPQQPQAGQSLTRKSFWTIFCALSPCLLKPVIEHDEVDVTDLETDIC
jgi:hypothetical protein